MSLVAAELERRGIATVAIQLLRAIAEAVRPPRALLVPFPFGYPLGAPNDPALQRQVTEEALALLEVEAEPPLLRELGEASTGAPTAPAPPSGPARA